MRWDISKDGKTFTWTSKRVLPLAVSAPFHCALMAPAAERLRDVLASVPIAPLRLPVISNVEATAYSSAAVVKDLLVRRSRAVFP